MALTFGDQQVFAKELMTTKDFLKKELSSSAKMTKETFPLAAAELNSLKSIAPDSDDQSITFYYGKQADGKLDKACTILPQKGKEGPIIAGVCFSPSGLIASVTILQHQEERGMGIEEQSFLKQFNGKKVSDGFVLGQDVNGISGATWSSKAMAEVTRKASFAFKTFVGEKK
jgi:Na+-translocating ferredoxin:NAD+ oxidoreductase RnfG subunit